jgi:hypothetical protein
MPGSLAIGRDRRKMFAEEDSQAGMNEFCIDLYSGSVNNADRCSGADRLAVLQPRLKGSSALDREWSRDYWKYRWRSGIRLLRKGV